MSVARNNRRRKAKATRKLARWRWESRPSLMSVCLDAMAQLGRDLAVSLNEMAREMRNFVPILHDDRLDALTFSLMAHRRQEAEIITVTEIRRDIALLTPPKDEP